MPTLKEKHDAYMRRLKASGVRLAEFKCPECDAKILTRVPDAGDIYDSMCACPECEGIFFKIVHPDGRVEV